MNKLEEYCEILGVQPGASADQVRRSFHDRIKLYHPDHRASQDSEKATQLIEAYQVLKQGVPLRRNASATPNTSAYRRGYDVGEKILRNIFSASDAQTQRSRFQKMYGFSPSSNHKYSQQASQRTDKNTLSDYLRAEDILSQIIGRYHRNQENWAKPWVREYIAELTRLQVLYRDINRLYPSYSGRAMRRLQQIHSLIKELKYHLHR